MLTAYAGLIYQAHKYDGQRSITNFEFDTNLKGFLRFLARLCVNSALGLGISLFGFMVEAIERKVGNPPKVA